MMNMMSFQTTKNTDKYIGGYVCMCNFDQTTLLTSADSEVNVPLEMLNVDSWKIYQLISFIRDGQT